jgi:Na+-transporting NADH:ubiquinone oxidoreductase subunit A
MGLHKVRKGLRLPILGEPEQTVREGRAPGRVALLAADYVGLRPTMHVEVGDDVQRGQLLLEDKRMPGVRYTAPGAGRVAAVHRGERRALQSVIIELSQNDRGGRGEEVSFRSFTGKHPSGLTRDEVRELLLESGMWTALRARPFGRVASPDERPHSIFVTAVDSHPLAPLALPILEGHSGDFERGLLALAKLTEGVVFVCTDRSTVVPLPTATDGERFRLEQFVGPHPSGTVGFHIHRLDPVNRGKTVWHLGLQDALAIGRLFETGKLHVERIVSLAGPAVSRPRLIRTRLGASTDVLVEGELVEGENRVISGSVFCGRKASGEVHGYLGRYSQQISVLREGREREFFGWFAPGLEKFSVSSTFLSKVIPGKRFGLTTSTNGSRRAIVPIGLYERVMPMDLMPTHLLRALLMRDVETSEELGCLELDEEDLELCTFVDPGKNDFGPYLRDVLTTIEKEG